MARRLIRIECGPRTAGLLTEALRAFVDKTFPPGTSPCNQAARESLLSAVRAIESEYGSTGQAAFSSRLRGQFKAALTWYFDGMQQQRHMNLDAERQAMLDLIKGQPIRDEQLSRLDQADS